MKNILKILIILQILVQTNCTEIPDDLGEPLKGCDSVFDSATHFCYDGNVYALCGSVRYNPTTHICQSGVADPAKCGGVQYNPVENGCCGSIEFRLAEDKRCQSGVVETKCGATGWYDATNTNLRCQNNVIETRCGTSSAYYDATNTNLRCQNNVIETKCGTGWYNASSMEYCSNGTVKTYETVTIGEQTWMAENLNYEAEGSKCYNNLESNCDIYGRLYNWATAMALDASCNSTSCSNLIESKHRGICPEGWHIPSYAEWDALSSFIQSDKSCSSCDAKHLKSVDGWYKSVDGWLSNGNGEDTYGFAALPGGGYGSSSGNFSSVGSDGYWWSSIEFSSFNGSSKVQVYSRHLSFSREYAIWNDGYDGLYKANLYSVRCVQD